MFGILSHVSVGSNDTARAARFYDATMAVVGAKRIMTIYQRTSDNEIIKEMGPATEPKENCSIVAVAYGKFAPEFWVGGAHNREEATPGNGVHVSFSGKNKEMVDAWHAAALAAGGVDYGAPGPRPQYGKQYYGAFIVDPDGNRIECMYWDMGWMGYCAIQ
eukprot:INCI3818.1.p1 GENE.INCI3818.1~~INCI3818.1.p1  ORF type:complete len:161 (+),score=18.28 INCI3818.1:138-620(+)